MLPSARKYITEEPLCHPRDRKEIFKMMEDAMARDRRERGRRGRRDKEAVAIVRLSGAVVAERALSYLGKVRRVNPKRLFVSTVRGEDQAIVETFQVL